MAGAATAASGVLVHWMVSGSVSCHLLFTCANKADIVQADMQCTWVVGPSLRPPPRPSLFAPPPSPSPLPSAHTYCGRCVRVHSCFSSSVGCWGELVAMGCSTRAPQQHVYVHL